jgi:hypothetical protein
VVIYGFWVSYRDVIGKEWGRTGEKQAVLAYSLIQSVLTSNLRLIKVAARNIRATKDTKATGLRSCLSLAVLKVGFKLNSAAAM